MKLYSFFLLTLSFICTLSAALPASSRCVPINEDGAPLRIVNGAGISLFSNQVRINVEQQFLQPTTFYPYGGFVVNIINDYCRTIFITFRWPNGAMITRAVGAGSVWPHEVIPRSADPSGMLRVAISDHLY